MGVEKVRKDDTARTFEFLFRFNRVWINSRLLLLLKNVFFQKLVLFYIYYRFTNIISNFLIKCQISPANTFKQDRD